MRGPTVVRRLAVVLLGHVLSGCVPLGHTRVPFVRPPATALHPPPAIYVSYRAQNLYGGKAPVRPEFHFTPRIDEAYLRVSRESPLLANATVDREDRVHYVLVLDAFEDHFEGPQYMIGAASLFVFAGVRWKEFAVVAKLRDASNGEVVSRATTSSRIDEIVWLPLLPLMPLSMALAPGPEDFYDRTFTDAFDELATSIRDRPLPPTAEASLLAEELGD